jgi:hypothetical protein
MEAGDSRNYQLFVLGAVLGSVCGLILGSIAAIEIGAEVASVARLAFNKVLRREKKVNFELLLQ